MCVSVCAVTWVSLSCVNYFALLSHSLLLFSCPPPTPCVLLFTLPYVSLSVLLFACHSVRLVFCGAPPIGSQRALLYLPYKNTIYCCFNDFSFADIGCNRYLLLLLLLFLLLFLLLPLMLLCSFVCFKFSSSLLPFPPIDFDAALVVCFVFCACLFPSLSRSLSLSMCVRVFTVRFSYWLFVLSLRDINTKNHQQHQQQQQKEKQKKKQQQQRTKYPLDLARI